MWVRVVDMWVYRMEKRRCRRYWTEMVPMRVVYERCMSMVVVVMRMHWTVHVHSSIRIRIQNCMCVWSRLR